MPSRYTLYAIAAGVCRIVLVAEHAPSHVNAARHGDRDHAAREPFDPVKSPARIARRRRWWGLGVGAAVDRRAAASRRRCRRVKHRRWRRVKRRPSRRRRVPAVPAPPRCPTHPHLHRPLFPRCRRSLRRLALPRRRSRSSHLRGSRRRNHPPPPTACTAASRAPPCPPELVPVAPLSSPPQSVVAMAAASTEQRDQGAFASSDRKTRIFTWCHPFQR